LIATGYVLASTSFVNNENPLLAPPLLLKPKVPGSQRCNFKCPLVLVPERKISFRQKNEYRIFKRRKQGFPAVQDDNKKRPIKILHVASHNSVRAGGSIQMTRLAIGLKQRGHDVYCAFNIKGGDDPSGLGTFGQLTGAGIKVSSFPMQRLRKYFGMFKFRRFLASHKFDIVHTHRFRALKFVYTASLGMDIPALLGNKKNSFPISPGQAKIYGSKKVDSIIKGLSLNYVFILHFI